MANVADLNDEDTIATARRARGAPNVTGGAQAVPDVGAQVQNAVAQIGQKAQNTINRGAAPAAPSVAGNLPEAPFSIEEAVKNSGAARASDGSKPPLARAAPTATGATMYGAPGQAPSTVAPGPAPGTSPSVAADLPAAEAATAAAPAAESVLPRIARTLGGRAGAIGAVGTAALSDLNKPTESMPAPNLGDAFAGAVSGLGPNELARQRIQNTARFVGDVGTRAIGTGVDAVDSFAKDTLKGATAPGTPLGVGMDLGNYFSGRPSRFDDAPPATATNANPAALPVAAPPAGAATTVAGNLPDAGGVTPVFNTGQGNSNPPAPQDQSPADALNSTAPGTAVVNGRVVSAKEISDLSNRNVIPKDNFVDPNGNRFSNQSASNGNSFSDNGDSERRGILSSLQAEHAQRAKRLNSLVNEAESEAMAGHKRRAGILSGLAQTLDKGTPDYAAYMRGNRNVYQSGAQQAQEEARANEENAKAQGETITAKQKSIALSLQQQAASEEDPKKRANILDRLDVLSGQHGKRYQQVQRVSGYNDLGQPIYSTDSFDTYTGKRNNQNGQ